MSSALIRMELCLFLICTVLLYTEAKYVHKDLALIVCSDRNTFIEAMNGLDGEETWHAIFSQEKGVMTLPPFADPFVYMDGTYEQAVYTLGFCAQNLETCIDGYKYPAEAKVAPHSSVYSKHDVQLGSKKTLICYITGFYPPQIKVSWTRNNVNVTDGVSLSRFYINSDGTYKLVSHLSFTAEEGDIYTCTVEHTALERPLTRTWDVQVALPSVGPAVFCGVGLAAGLLGVAVGTFFLVKGNNCN